MSIQKAYKLRDYQIEAVDAVLNAVDSGVRRSAVVLATGGGKTVVMAHIAPKLQPIESQGSKILILAHKEELVRQLAKTMREVNPSLEVQIDMSRSKPDPSADIIVASVPTLARMTRLSWYRPQDFKAIFLDECHHATATSWTKILNHFSALDPDSNIAVVGFTATMERSDGAALGTVFEEVVFNRDLLTMIKSKELCDVKFSTMKVDFSLEGVRTRFGDYATADLGNAINREEINLQVSKAYLQLKSELNFKSTLIFCVDVAHCVTLCGVLQANGINAQYVTGETVRHERRAILEDFKDGKIDVLCNVLVFTEGTDIPNIDSLILARPTKSRPLLTQMIGRGLRLHQGKDFCHVVDMVGTMKVGVSSVPTLLGLAENHNIHNKRFEDLIHDKEDVDEREKAEKRDSEVREILDLQRQLEKVQLDFNHIDGFATMINPKMKVLGTKSAREEIRNSMHSWVRLEYETWGCPIHTHSSYFTIEKNEEDAGFSLYRTKVATFEQLRASDFKCSRKTKEAVNSGSITFLLSIADSTLGRVHYQMSGGITKTQSKRIVKLLTRNVTSNYGPETANSLEAKISTLSKRRASDLIFAAEVSVNSLQVKWELKQLLGLPLKLQAKYERQTRSIMKKLETQGLSGGDIPVLKPEDEITRGQSLEDSGILKAMEKLEMRA